MGRQTEFYAHPDDYGALEEGLHSHSAVAIGRRSPTNEPVIRSFVQEHGSVDVLLTHWRYLGALHPRYSEHQETWICSVSDDPLVELDMLQPRKGTWRPGRIYYIPRELVESEYQDKPSEFIAFAEQIRRWLRRWCQRREGLLMTPSLAARFDRGEVGKGNQGYLELLTDRVTNH
jgi:hypothetical protein